MNRVVHFEIQAENPERAMTFYTAVFGWTFEQWGENKYWMVMTAEKDSKEPGINGGLLPRMGGAKVADAQINAFVCKSSSHTLSPVYFERLFERNRRRRPEAYRDMSRVEEAIAAEKTPKDMGENDPLVGYGMGSKVQVDAYDATHDKILAAGGVVALPKVAIPGMAWQGYYKDTDGNIFGVHQADVNAK